MTPHRPDIERVIKTIREQLQILATSIGLTPLRGDASNRVYYRVSLRSTPLHCPQSLVLMQLADPEGFKESEEAISTSDIPIAELPFANVHAHRRIFPFLVSTTTIAMPGFSILKISGM